MRGEGSSRIGHVAHERQHPIDVIDMHDQRVVGRTSLGLEQSLHCGAIERVRAKAIDRFGRKRDKTATPETLGRGRKRGGIRSVGIDANHLGHIPIKPLRAVPRPI